MHVGSERMLEKCCFQSEESIPLVWYQGELAEEISAKCLDKQYFSGF